MAFGGGPSEGGGSISDINVTPLVYVMLVLLIIFMVTAPILQQASPSICRRSPPRRSPATRSSLVVNVNKPGRSS